MTKHIYVSTVREEVTDTSAADAIELVACTLNDAIKTSLVESVKNRVIVDKVEDSVLQAQIKKTEIIWYLDHLYTKEQTEAIDKKVLIPQVFQKLMESRTVNMLKHGKYVVSSEAIQQGEELSGVLLTAHHEKVKRVKRVEPSVEY